MHVGRGFLEADLSIRGAGSSEVICLHHARSRSGSTSSTLRLSCIYETLTKGSIVYTILDNESKRKERSKTSQGSVQAIPAIA